ncbi:hypothetical protein [Ruania albidiflava]|uniref:hypothetical protein n=1 Tax=Ruania albidiflava TaxID=366586 RepID=UPI0003B6AEAE|nr:hypothetical protein [Ruania albidiflava]
MGGSELILVALAACAGAVTLLLFHASPRLTFAVWASVLFFVPVWVGVTVGFFWSAITLVTLAALAANIKNLRIIVADILMLLFVALALLLFTLDMASLAATLTALLEWTLPYIWGRIVLSNLDTEYLTKLIALVAMVAATLAIVEVLSGQNVFSAIPALSPELYAEWSPPQFRGGSLRAEGAWGHSIALGAALSMSSSFIMAARWSGAVRVLGLAVVSTATVLTLSRIGMATLVLTIVLSLVVLPQLSRALRFGLAASALLAALIVVPFVETILLRAGEEAAGSADYRSQLFSLVGQLRPFGGATDWSVVIDDVYLGSFARSIDNAALLFALRFGWVPALLLLVILVLAALPAFRRAHSSPAAVAVAAQVPALFAVALITQFGVMLWFLAGVAVSWRQAKSTNTAPDEARNLEDRRYLKAGAFFG